MSSPSFSESQRILRLLADSWIEEFNHYEIEMRNCERSLEEFILAVKPGLPLARIERFQNQFIRQREVINDLKHRIRLFFQGVEPGAEISDPESGYFSTLDAEVETFRELYMAMLSDFDPFIQQLDSEVEASKKAPPKKK